MGEINTLFFDTYAFFEIINGNKNYEKYIHKIAIITTKLNLMELHYGLLLKYGVKKANLYYDDFVEFTVEIPDNLIKKANEFRASMKKNKISYIDCLGYIIAKSRNIKFLTGDKEFELLDNVEFVK